MKQLTTMMCNENTLFTKSVTGGGILRPMGTKSGLIIFSDGSHGMRDRLDEEIMQGFRKVYSIEGASPVDTISISDFYGFLFAEKVDGLGGRSKIILTHGDNETINVVTEAGNTFSYRADSVQKMIDGKQILIYTV